MTPDLREKLYEAARECGENHVWFGADEDGAVYVGCYDVKYGRARLVEGWYWETCLERLLSRSEMKRV